MLVGALGVAAHTTRVLNASRGRDAVGAFTFTPWELQVPYEPVSFRAGDGVTLRGWWLPRPETGRVVIGCTGHRGAKHELLGIACGLWRAGSNVLLFDFRGCGESDAATLSVGHHELLDVRAAVHFTRQHRPGAQIGLLGYSMGAAVAILAAAADPSVGVVVADSAYAALRDIIAQAYRRRRLPPGPLLGLSDALNRRRYGWSFAASRPLEVVGRIAPRPLLIIHGGADTLTPVEHAYRLYAAAGEPKELWVVEGARHCGAYFIDRPTYLSHVAQFFAAALPA